MCVCVCVCNVLLTYTMYKYHFYSSFIQILTCLKKTTWTSAIDTFISCLESQGYFLLYLVQLLHLISTTSIFP